MELNDAISLLVNNDFDPASSQQWADLGCGSGTFTLALASLLPPESTIHAVDINASSLKNIPGLFNNVTIGKTVLDIGKAALPYDNLSGILMANSLHYIKDQERFIQRASTSLRPGGIFIIVEYDTSKANPWVPYPLEFVALKKLFIKTGFPIVRKLNEKPSLFGRANLYSAMAMSTK